MSTGEEAGNRSMVPPSILALREVTKGATLSPLLIFESLVNYLLSRGRRENENSPLLATLVAAP